MATKKTSTPSPICMHENVEAKLDGMVVCTDCGELQEFPTDGAAAPKTAALVVVESQPLQTTTLEGVKKSFDEFIETRDYILKRIGDICIEGKDFFIIQGRKSMGKGAAEKVCQILKLRTEMVVDKETVSLLPADHDWIVYLCNVYRQGSDEIIGQGRGAASGGKNQGDLNKTMKMAQKSAYIDGVIRVGGLSDVFTQDIHEMDEFKDKAPQFHCDICGYRSTAEQERDAAKRGQGHMLSHKAAPPRPKAPEPQDPTGKPFPELMNRITALLNKMDSAQREVWQGWLATHDSAGDWKRALDKIEARMKAEVAK